MATIIRTRRISTTLESQIIVVPAPFDELRSGNLGKLTSGCLGTHLTGCDE